MSQWTELEKRFDALQPRERVLMSVAVGVLLVFFLYLLWIEPAGKAAAASQMQIDSLEPQVDGVRIALERVEQELARDPEAERRVALDGLRAEAASIDERLRADEARVIAPATMPLVLRDLLGRDKRLVVVGVDALPPQALRWSPALNALATMPAAAGSTSSAAVDVGPEANVPTLYRHRVVLRFEGDFDATLDYLRAVEALPFRLRLNDLEVDGSRWPRLSMRLQIETLGLEEGWIGV